MLFCLEQGYDVVVEGILWSGRYRDLLLELADAAREAHVFYLDVSFEETLRRHQTKPNAHEFGEPEMREWFRDNDLLGVAGEHVIPEDATASEIVERIIAHAYAA